jgi:hypothetical protein
MHRTPLRIGILVLGLAITAGLGYRVFQDEQSLDNIRRDAARAESLAAGTNESLIDLRASLHAYVAPGQGLPFWAKRAQGTLDQLRDNLRAIDASISPSGGSLAESLDAVDQMTAAERRARTHVSRGENDLAADVIFTEVRDLLATVSGQLDAVRGKLEADADRRLTAARNEQSMLAAASLGLWILIAIALTPVAQRSAKDPAQWRAELKETLAKPAAIVVPEPAVVVNAAAPSESIELPRDVGDAAGRSETAPEAPPLPVVPLATVREVSDVCADLSALSDPNALEGALARITQVLDATGLIVWAASNDTASLAPVATHGFDPRLVSRIGRIPRDSANLTAAAFRENVAKMSVATATTPAALAVAMCGPTGPTGVLSIELKPGQMVDDSKVALAAIVAAQLSTLAMPVPAAEPEQAAAQRAAV